MLQHYRYIYILWSALDGESRTMAPQNTFRKRKRSRRRLSERRRETDKSRHCRRVLQHRPGAARGSDRDAKKGGKMIQNDFTIHIRRAESGDEACLAHVQAESGRQRSRASSRRSSLPMHEHRARRENVRAASRRAAGKRLYSGAGRQAPLHRMVGRRARRGYAGRCRAAGASIRCRKTGAAAAAAG